MIAASHFVAVTRMCQVNPGGTRPKKAPSIRVTSVLGRMAHASLRRSRGPPNGPLIVRVTKLAPIHRRECAAFSQRIGFATVRRSFLSPGGDCARDVRIAKLEPFQFVSAEDFRPPPIGLGTRNPATHPPVVPLR